MHKPKLGITGIKWLKALHLTLAVIWLGSAISMNLLRVAWTPLENGDLYAVDHAIVLIDHWVVVPAAFGALLTGLLEGWLTTWGFIKYRLVTVKLGVTVGLMVYAPLFQAQWARAIESISRIEGLAALQNPVYLQDRMLYTLSGIGLIIALAILPLISVHKPWMKKARLPRASSQSASSS